MNFPSVGSSSGTPEPPEDYYVAGMELLLAIGKRTVRRNVGSNHGLSRVRQRAAKTVKALCNDKQDGFICFLVYTTH